MELRAHTSNSYWEVAKHVHIVWAHKTVNIQMLPGAPVRIYLE